MISEKVIFDVILKWMWSSKMQVSRLSKEVQNRLFWYRRPCSFPFLCINGSEPTDLHPENSIRHVTD
jgi:hypothetical protein